MSTTREQRMIDIYGADRASWPNSRATDPGWAQDPEARQELRELNRQDREHEASPVGD